MNVKNWSDSLSFQFFFVHLQKIKIKMDKKRIEGIRNDINTLLSDAVRMLKEMETKAYEEREIDLMKPISNTRKNIQENKVRMVKELDKLSKMKSNW